MFILFVNARNHVVRFGEISVHLVRFYFCSFSRIYTNKNLVTDENGMYFIQRNNFRTLILSGPFGNEKSPLTH